MRRKPPSLAKRKRKRRRRPPPEPAPPQEGLPKVAIVGRPNVGKSTLFNVWTKRRRSVVSATPGTTRDRIGAVARAPRPDGSEVTFVLIDAGGVGIVDDRRIADEVTQQIDRAIGEADVLLLLLDARAGLLPLDHRIAQGLRKTATPVVVAATKCETEALELEAANFQTLGLGEVIPVSAEARKNLDILRERVGALLPEVEPPAPADDAARICVTGRQNAGKSTFVNTLVGDERVAVSELPGTTRDPVDVRAEIDGRPVVLVDTAGVHRRREGRSAPDHFSLAASRRSIERAEAVILLIDAHERVGTVERELCKIINRNCRPCAIVINKWDLAEAAGATSDAFTTYLEQKLPELSHAPVVYASALRGERVVDAVSVAADLVSLGRTRRPTSELNRMLRRAIQERHPSSRRGALPKVYYAAQAGISPPTVVVFVNDVSRFAPSYVQFLENRFREYWDEETGAGEVPVRVILRPRPRQDRRTSAKREPNEIA